MINAQHLSLYLQEQGCAADLRKCGWLTLQPTYQVAEVPMQAFEDGNLLLAVHAACVRLCTHILLHS